EGFDYADSEAVRADALGAGVEERLDNAIDGVIVASHAAASDVLERVADVPIYFADPIVRRAPSLQKTRAAAVPVARIAPVTLAALGVASGARVRVAAASGEGVELVAVADDGLAPNCGRVAAAHATTAALGAMSGQLGVERV